MLYGERDRERDHMQAPTRRQGERVMVTTEKEREFFFSGTTGESYYAGSTSKWKAVCLRKKILFCPGYTLIKLVLRWRD